MGLETLISEFGNYFFGDPETLLKVEPSRPIMADFIYLLMQTDVSQWSTEFRDIVVEKLNLHFRWVRPYDFLLIEGCRSSRIF